MVYAVIDTNIFVSALITHNSNASTARVLESLFLHRIIPLYNDDIIKEYDEVLHRAKFKLSEEQISTVIEHVKENELILLVFLTMEKCQMRTTGFSMKSA